MKTQITLMLDLEIVGKMKEEAEEKERSVSFIINKILKDYCEIEKLKRR